jgi:2-C-methyl-D-erythritol 4-phosphate cytidylyltransferase
VNAAASQRPLYAVIPAAGVGRRMGGECPKQYLSLGGVPLLHHSVRALLQQPHLARVAVALHLADERAGELPILEDPRVLRVTGGLERADSVLAGLEALADIAREDDWVLVHDAARPCLPQADLQRLVDRVLATGVGAILAQPVLDTLKQADASGCVQTTVDRSRFWRAQTPQMFRLGELREALRQALAAGIAVTDEASAMERAGFPVQLVEGSAANLKVTVPGDLALAAFYLGARPGQGVTP